MTNYRNRHTPQPEILEAIENTKHDLNINLQRIGEKLDASETTPDASTDLQEEKAATEECLRVCGEVQAFMNSRKENRYFTVREAIVDGNSDQVLVATDIDNAQSTGRSAQLIGTMPDDSLQQLSRSRYR